MPSRPRPCATYATARFAPIGAALKLKLEDRRWNGTGWQIHLHEKGGKEHKMPCHHGYRKCCTPMSRRPASPTIARSWLFRTSPEHNATMLTEQPMNQSAVWFMVRRRTVAAGTAAAIGNHTFRATSTTRLYDRRKERITQAQVEKIRL